MVQSNQGFFLVEDKGRSVRFTEIFKRCCLLVLKVEGGPKTGRRAAPEAGKVEKMDSPVDTLEGMRPAHTLFQPAEIHLRLLISEL